jgi:predicted nucleic acid-binding protein
VDIRGLPSGTRCLVDANIFVYHLGVKRGDCTEFLDRVARKEIRAHVTTVIVAEVLHRQMLIEAVNKGLVSPGRALKKLKDNPTIISSLTDYAIEVEKLLRLPLSIIEVTPADLLRSHALRLASGLFVNDSINLACAERHAITDIVTHDADFGRVPGISIWGPTDV